MAEITLLELPVSEFLDRLASSAPAPGGGAAAAVCAALAAALGGMVCELTLGKPRFATVQEEIGVLRSRFQRARELLGRLVDEDAAAYADLAAAFKLSKSDPARPVRIAAAAETAACVPLETAAVAGRIVADALRLQAIGNPSLAADTSAALSMARAGITAAAANVQANLPFVPEPRRSQLSDNINAVISRA